MRLFVAADVPDAARAAIAAEQERLRAVLRESAGSLRWVKPEHAHLTLVFLGNVDALRVDAVTNAVAAAVPVDPFDVVFDGLGAFPPRGAPRVLWMGITDGAQALIELQRELADRVARVGVTLEDRAFHPHLTLARWRESRSVERAHALAAAGRVPIARARVDGATLYESRLSPAGPAYTARARATLTVHS